MKQTVNVREKNFKTQGIILSLGLFLFGVKFIAWFLTDSVSILSDALEGIINIVTGTFGLYALYLVKLPSDDNHPYGHGKAEFVTAGVEGLLIMLAGVYIAIEGSVALFYPRSIGRIDLGIFLISVAGMVNFALGWYALKKGKENKSFALESTGKHLISDAYTTLGITMGLLVMHLTGELWIDALISVILAALLMRMGYKIVRKSLSGMMDEADEELVKEIIEILGRNKKPEWVRFKGIRVIQSGSIIHIDGFVYLPPDFTVFAADQTLREIHDLLVLNFGDGTETAFVVRAAK
jgi:cation diffusion facilitator family transporter